MFFTTGPNLLSQVETSLDELMTPREVKGKHINYVFKIKLTKTNVGLGFSIL